MQGWNNYDWSLETIKWGADFMVKAVEAKRLLLHIGDIPKDHGYIGRSEYYPQIDRKIRHCGVGALHTSRTTASIAWSQSLEAGPQNGSVSWMPHLQNMTDK